MQSWIFNFYSALSKLQRVLRASMSCVLFDLRSRLSIVDDSGFWCEFWIREDPVIKLLPKMPKTSVSSRLFDSSKDLLSCCTNNKIKLGFVTPIGMPGAAVFQGTLACRKVVWPKYFVGGEQFFELLLPFAMILLRFSSPGKLPRLCVSSQNLQCLFRVRVV